MTSQLGTTVFDLAVARHDGELVILAACESGVFVSRDKAETWSGLWAGGMATAVTASPSFASDGVIIAGVQGGIIQSDDVGVSWAFHSLERPDSLIASVSIRTSEKCSTLMLAGTVDDGLYRSADGGMSWLPSNCGAYIPRITSVLASNGRLSLAGTDVGPFVSTNDGLTWDDELAGEIDAEVTALAVEDDFVIMGTALAGVYARRMNTDQAWIQLSESTLIGAITAVATVPASDGSIRIVAIGNTHMQRYRFEDGDHKHSVQLLRTDPLPKHAVTSAIASSGKTLQAAVADAHGEILLFRIGPDGVSCAHHD
jgi:hypothetical protein